MLKKLHICCFLFALIQLQKPAFGQQIVNGNFDKLLFWSSGNYSAYTIDNDIRISQPCLCIRLVNFPPQGPYSPQDSLFSFSQGSLRWAFFDSTDTLMFRHTWQYPKGVFVDGYPTEYRSQFKTIPFPNRVTFNFINWDIKKMYGPQCKYGYSSLKLSINYSSNLIIGKQYLLTIYDMASDTVAADSWTKSENLDSLFIGSALNDSSVGDTIAITHPQRGIWNKRFIPFTPTKAYSHFTIGNYSAQSSNIAGNMIDECYLFSIQSTLADTLLVCPGDSLWVKPKGTFIRSEWNDGDTSAAKFLYNRGWHICYSYPDSNTVVIDSFYLLSANHFSYHTDTTLCENKPLVLSSSFIASHAKYTWSSGDTTANIITLANNLLWCQTNNQNGCIITDSFFITRSPAIHLQLGSDTILCYGETKIIGTASQLGIHYRWNTNDTIPKLPITKAGKYTLKAFNQYCFDSASIHITAKNLIHITLPVDTVFCFDDLKTLLLKAGGQFVSYLWQPTGERTSSIYATMPQKYIVFVKDSSNCDGSDSTLVSETCPDFVFIPNAFTPNGDGLNDVFLPKTRSLQSYQMSIINRWGEIVFTTQNPLQGWDGQNAPSDVYVVSIHYQVIGKLAQSVSKNITLLR